MSSYPPSVLPTAFVLFLRRCAAEDLFQKLKEFRIRFVRVLFPAPIEPTGCIGFVVLHHIHRPCILCSTGAIILHVEAKVDKRQDTKREKW